MTSNISKIIDEKPVKQVKEYPLDANRYAGIYISGQDTLELLADGDRLKIIAAGQRLKEELSGKKQLPDLTSQELEHDLFLGFILPIAGGKLTYFDLASEQQKILSLSEDYREIVVGKLKLRRVFRP